jgi:hypothetical protein
MQTFKLPTTPGILLSPTATFRYKEVKPQELLLDTILPPEFKLQQLYVDNQTGDFEWRDIPMVPYGAPDTGNIAA